MKLTKEEKQDLAYACYVDPLLFFKTFFIEWFSEDIPWVHRGIVAILLQKVDFLLQYGELDKICRHFIFEKDGETHSMFYVEEDILHLVAHDQIGIMMPRGFSKTTLFIACLIYMIVYRLVNFPLLVSETATHSETQLNNVRKVFEDNAKLKEVFGDLQPGRQENLKWTDKQIATKNDVNVVARGRGGQVRGLNINATRPDLIMVDDLEDTESVSTEEQREKASKWFFSDLLPCRAKKNSRVVVLGTCLHDEALLMKLGQDPTFTFVRFGAIDKDGDPLWEYNMSLDKLEKLKQSYVRAGRLADFYLEYMSQVRNDESAKFKQSYIRYALNPPVVTKAIVLDPAIGQKRTSDRSAIVVAGMGETGQIHVFENWNARGATPRELIDKYFELSKIWLPDHHGVESVAYQAALVHLLREEMFRKNYYFEPIPITHKQKKYDRILGILQPRYAAGYITHQRIFPELEEELLDFPAKKDDNADALAMAVALLDPYAAQAADPALNLEDDEYEELIYAEYGHAP